jgi:hypothetical protein
MSRVGSQLLTVAVMAFVASTMIFSLWPLAPVPEVAQADWSGLPSELEVTDLAWLFLHPRNPGMLALLAAVWAGLCYHLLRLWLESHRVAQARRAHAHGRALAPHLAGPPAPDDLVRQHVADNSLVEHGPLILALLAGAIWPWLLEKWPVASFLLSTVTLAGTLAAALRGLRLGRVVNHSSTLGFVAGWALLVCLAIFAELLEQHLGVPETPAVGIAQMIGAVAAVSVQLRMPRRTGFSVALIWGLIGVAASTVSTNATIATGTVLAIAVIAVALVRVTT